MLETEIEILLKVLKEHLSEYENKGNIQDILIANTILTTIIKFKRKINYIIIFNKNKYFLPKNLNSLSNKLFSIIKTEFKLKI